MAVLHRLQWIDAHVRAGRYPNTRQLAEQFEISRRQALRDFEYMRDSLGAPLAYSALHRGYYYTEDAYTLPGPYVTTAQREVLGHLATYYDTVSRQAKSPIYREMADLFARLGGAKSDTSARPQGWDGLAPFRALLRPMGSLAQPPSTLAPYWRGFTADGLAACEYRDADAFIATLLGCGVPLSIQWPGWLRERLQEQLFSWLRANGADVTRHVTAPLIESSQKSTERVKSPAMTKRTSAALAPTWNSYAGSAWGVLKAANLTDLSFSAFMGLSGNAFRFCVHPTCHVACVTVYPWTEQHQAGMERVGVLAESFDTMPDAPTYEAAARRAVANIRSSIDRGVGVILWGVDTGEFGVVCGYDDEDGVLLTNGVFNHHGGQSGPILYENVGKTFATAPILHYQIPLERVPVDLAQSRKAALRFYVEEMEAPFRMSREYPTGFAAYDAWEGALASEKFEAFGLRYLTAVYSESKRCAAEFLRAAVSEAPALKQVAELFDQIAALYSRMLGALEMGLLDSSKLHAGVSPTQASALLPLVREAGALERQAVALVKRYLSEK